MDKEKMIEISAKDLLKLFAENDYPIRYSNGNPGIGMGYGDFEKLVEHIEKQYRN